MEMKNMKRNCENCWKETEEKEMIIVRIRTYSKRPGAENQIWCTTCYNR
tara:strand:+ start:403 stop:549 length:147 start_codon:yes stop_codon:yes gene_type:complete